MTTESKALVLPAEAKALSITESDWTTLKNSLYPGAQDASILLVLHYCKSRKLDPMKKPCHIVPIRVKQGNDWVWRDVVMPGIYEYRTTAQRTGQYLGHSKPAYGATVEAFGVKAPEYCELTVYRYSEAMEERVEYPVRVYFSECVALKDGVANQRWAKAPIQMLTKCTEAAGLREAFPDELGGEPTVEEVEGHDTVIEGNAVRVEKPRPGKEAVADLQPADAAGQERRKGLIADLGAKADEGMEPLRATWAAMSQEDRDLVGTDFGRIKKIAEAADSKRNG